MREGGHVKNQSENLLLQSIHKLRASCDVCKLNDLYRASLAVSTYTCEIEPFSFPAVAGISWMRCNCQMSSPPLLSSSSHHHGTKCSSTKGNQPKSFSSSTPHQHDHQHPCPPLPSSNGKSHAAAVAPASSSASTTMGDEEDVDDDSTLACSIISVESFPRRWVLAGVSEPAAISDLLRFISAACAGGRRRNYSIYT